ncbi:helix-turn-helix domain-containing protein [Rothia nasimurium]|uniref:helix-turn-helix domain-containing protein n=1 Tax=Rothia nasimurium TaxID=85336 RepID=UPI002DD6B114|nr:helix-turn-helix domain-containing protein [Rothia nasimurium]
MVETVVVIGAAIRDARRHFRLTQLELVELVGVSDRTVRDIEKGRSGPRCESCGHIRGRCSCRTPHERPTRGSNFFLQARLSRASGSGKLPQSMTCRAPRFIG